MSDDGMMVSLRLNVTAPNGRTFGAWLTGCGFSKGGVFTFLADDEDEVRTVQFRQLGDRPGQVIYEVTRASSTQRRCTFCGEVGHARDQHPRHEIEASEARWAWEQSLYADALRDGEAGR